jgi:UrcA family protein
MSFAQTSKSNTLSVALRGALLATALGALALPAAAASIKVNVNIAGLDAKTAHSQIVRAAETACSAALQGSTFDRYYQMGPCIDEAIANAEAKTAANDHRYASVQNTGR